MTTCLYCTSKNLYSLDKGYFKCALCKKKFSSQKWQSNQLIIEAFCNNKTARQCQMQQGKNYITVHNKYKKLRNYIVAYSELQYSLKKQNSFEYDEYLYLKSKNIYDAQNFLTFIYDDKIYNLMLPSLYKFKPYYDSHKELNKFLFLNKIAKLQSKSSRINEFWDYLENFLKKYKGIEAVNFIWYLKEAEFKFNYTQEEQFNILKEVLTHPLR